MSKPRKNRPDSPQAKVPVTDSPDFDLSFPAAPNQGTAPQPPPAASGDGELELEDAGERVPQRMKIPEQRRESPMFEVAGQVPRPADARDKAPAAGFEGRVDQIWQAASEEEIESYDPVREPALAPSTGKAPKHDPEFDEPQPARVPSTQREKTKDLSELDEFLAKTADSSPEAATRKERRPFTKVEWICVGSGIALLLGLVFWLFNAATSGTGTDIHRSDARPDLPLEGDLITVDEITSGWRARKDTDRLARMEVVLPQPGEVLPGIIPQVNFTISGGSKSGYLRFIFKDSLGTARGDTRVVRVEGGKLVSLDNGEVISSATAGSVYSSNGLQDTSTFNTYASSEDARWSVEVSESASYDAKDKDWKFLSQFDIRSALLP